MDGKHGHSSSGGFHSYEQQLRRVQGENEYLRERIKSCERGLVSLWQVREKRGKKEGGIRLEEVNTNGSHSTRAIDQQSQQLHTRYWCLPVEEKPACFWSGDAFYHLFIDSQLCGCVLSKYTNRQGGCSHSS